MELFYYLYSQFLLCQLLYFSLLRMFVHCFICSDVLESVPKDVHRIYFWPFIGTVNTPAQEHHIQTTNCLTTEQLLRHKSARAWEEIIHAIIQRNAEGKAIRLKSIVNEMSHLWKSAPLCSSFTFLSISPVSRLWSDQLTSIELSAQQEVRQEYSKSQTCCWQCNENPWQILNQRNH